MSKIRRNSRVVVSVVLAMVFSIVSPVHLLGPAAPLKANAATLDFTASYLNFDVTSMEVLNGVSTSAQLGSVYLYPNAGVVEGVAVDATFEVITIDDSPSSFTWDSPSDAQFSGVTLNQDMKDIIILNMASADITWRVSFWEAGTVAYSSPNVTGVSVTLQNVLVNAYDLDVNQWVAFSGFQSYEVNSTSPLAVSNIGSSSLVKFLGPNSNYSGDASFQEGRVRVTYDQASSLDIRINAPSGALYGLQFGAGIAWPDPARFANPNNTAPTSSDTIKYVIPGTEATLNLADFGEFSDPDNNPWVDVKIETSADLDALSYIESGVASSVSAGSTYSVAAISSGQLRFTHQGAGPATISFKVGDGLAYSSNAYSLNLLQATTPQEITFPAPTGPINPGTGAFSSSATASSGLPVTLTSETPGTCTITNTTDIAPVLTNVRSTCVVTATQGGDSTYESAVPVTRTFQFSNQSVTFPQPNSVTFSAGLTIASAATADSGLTPTLTSLTPAVCSVSGLDILPIATGSCTVRAEQAGGVNNSITYLAAFPVLRTFAISQEPTYSVTYDANQGSGTKPNDIASTTSFVVGSGALERSGFSFVGWNTASDGSGTDYSVGQSVTLAGNLTLYAKWTALGETETQPPVYNGPLIEKITPNVVPEGGGQLIVVDGRRLGVGENVTIGGIQVKLESWSETRFSFIMPKLPAQSWDMIYTYDGGARLTYINAIRVTKLAAENPETSAPNAGDAVTAPEETSAKPWRVMEPARNFAPGSPVINSSVRADVELMLRKHARFATHIECVGFTMGPSVLSVDAKLSLDRAKAVCALIKKLRPRLEVVLVEGRQELELGGAIRRVEVTFTR